MDLELIKKLATIVALFTLISFCELTYNPINWTYFSRIFISIVYLGIMLHYFRK